MPAKQRSTGEALARARADVAAARLADPGEHFPYKIAVATQLLEDNPPMGPDGPDDDSVQAEDFMSQRIADASAAYIAAQAAFLKDPTAANTEAYRAATDDLVAARRTHRRSRVDADGKPVAAFVGITRAATPDYQRGPRLRRVGED